MKKQDISRQWQETRVGLWRPSNLKQLKREMKEDEEAIYASFRACGDDQRALKLFQHFRRYLLNTTALASHHGLLRGYECFELGTQLPKKESGKKHPGRYIIEFIRSKRRRHKNPELKVSNDALCAYLTKNRVPIETTWRAKIATFAKAHPTRFFEIFHVNVPGDDPWGEARYICPNLVASYLSRYRKHANNPQVLNALFVWPKIVRKHNAAKKTRRKQKTAAPKDGCL